MILLLPQPTGSPAKIQHAFRAVRRILIAPHAHLIGRHGLVGRRPIDRAGLLLHHPKRLALQAAHMVVKQRNRLPIGEPVRVIIPRDGINFRRQIKPVDFVVAGRDVGQNGTIRRMFAQNCGLGAAIFDLHRRSPAPIVKHQRRVVPAANRISRQWNLRPLGIRLAPKNRAPRFIQRRQRAVFSAQPGLKRGATSRTITASRAVITDFVINLPRRHRRMLTVTFSQRRDNAATQFAIAPVGQTRLPPATVRQAPPVRANPQHVGFGGGQPRGRSRSWCAKHNL